MICTAGRREELIRRIFALTSTLGIRESTFERHVLRREIITEETCLGSVRKKVSTGFGVRREKYEYDDLAAIAKEHGISIAEAREKILRRT